MSVNMRGLPLCRLALLTTLASGTVITSCSEPPSTQLPEIIGFQGICDGSAAVRIGTDQLLVAYDEENALYLYDIEGGSPVMVFSYGALLGINDDEVDIEAAVKVEDGIWWIGSHGLDGDGDIAPNRSLLFKTGLSDINKLLVLDIVRDLSGKVIDEGKSRKYFSKKTLKTLPKEGGVNIEGLAVLPNGDLLLGLRSPLTDGLTGDAIVVHLLKDGNDFQVKEFYTLDLGNRGIRDIQAHVNSFVIIAGDVGSGGVFALYEWSVDGATRVLSHFKIGLNPEALVRFSDHWLVLSDDGKVRRGDATSCDNLADSGAENDKNVFFRAIRLPLNSPSQK